MHYTAKNYSKLSAKADSFHMVCTGPCVGIEITGDDCIRALGTHGEELGAVTATTRDTAELFRYLGIDG